MHLDVLINQEDFNKYIASAIRFWSKKKKRVFNKVDLILYPTLFVVLLLYALRYGCYPHWLDFLFGILVGMILIVLISNEQKKILQPKAKGFVFGPTEYDFLEEGIKIKKDQSETLTKWAGVEKIFNARDYFYIFVDHNLSYIIPKRSFLSPEKLDEFLSLLNKYIPGKILSK